MKKRRRTRREKGGRRRGRKTRRREEQPLLGPFHTTTYPRSLVLICLLGFRATGQNSSCLSFGPFRPGSLSLSPLFCHYWPLVVVVVLHLLLLVVLSFSPPLFICSSFFFFTPSRFQSIARCAGTLKGLAAPSGRKEREREQRGFFESNPSLSTR